MKVFVSADIEGVSGFVSWDHSNEGSPGDYQLMRRRMSREVAAACRGALAGGAAEITVADSHAKMMNIIHEELPREARLIQGQNRPLEMMEGIDESFGAAFFIGYHARRNAPQAVLGHSFSYRSMYGIRINGELIGETGINAGIAGSFGVSVALVSGDDKTCREAEELIPGVVTVETKRGIGMVSGDNVHPETVYESLAAAGEEAAGKAGKIKPLVYDGDVLLEMDFVQSVQAEAALNVPGIERAGEMRAAFKGADFMEVARVLKAVYMICYSVSI